MSNPLDNAALAGGIAHPARSSALGIARELAEQFAQTAVERDERGGTPKRERDALRSSGLLALTIPTAYGGQGANWRETLEVVREFAGSIARLPMCSASTT